MSSESSLPVSGVVITLNEAANIRRCLDSLRFCAEVLVVDSGSDDGTPGIARSMGARVVHQDWLGFGPQKHFAVEQAAHDWVLCLDADEWVSEALGRSIRELLDTPPDCKAYRMPRRNILLGRALRYGGGYPDTKLRLFDRRHARWNQAMVHEQVETSAEVGLIEADLMHETAPDLPAAMAKWARYAAMQAAAMHASGKRSGWHRILFSPPARFLKQYVVQQGFRDGLAGFAMAAFSSYFCFFKYLELWRLQNTGDPEG
jgi:glycosyltransferase involved in cell wall biosynthesis